MATDLLPGLAPIVTWSLVIAGWYWVRHDNNAREDRKELRATINSLNEDIKSLTYKAHAYYLSSQDDASALLEIEILRDQEDIEARVARLRGPNLGFEREEPLARFRQALTGGDFKSASRIRKETSDRIFADTALAARKLTDYLESEYDKRYPRASEKTRTDFRRLPP
jgi:hypothetical protein